MVLIIIKKTYVSTSGSQTENGCVYLILENKYNLYTSTL